VLAFALTSLILAGDPASADAGVHRGSGWYSPGVAIPEPPIGLALVILGAAGMRLRERRRSRAR
jgi:hypothetical protein